MADEESRNEDAKKRPGNSSKKDNEASGKKDDHKKDAKGKDADKADKKSSKASGGKSDKAEKSDKASKAEKSEKAVKTAGKKGSTKPKRRGPIGAVFGFLREVVEQLRKVVYPTRKELLTYTTVVLIFVAFMITVITLLDMGFSEVSQMIFGVE
ncbi:MAG TPA: preprotein translocase subunit SecE [Candidatus Stackebrandtia excrementipullorum]|nr:preprotein translocase subunit SecE [Candidatus Stackebrandtia excrementipullorum]